MPLPLPAVFADVPDPRRETANKLHALTDVLTLATCAVIGGADTWDDIHEYADCKQAFFRRFLPLANGIPSADTFERVFAKLDPAKFAGGHRRQVPPLGRREHGHRPADPAGGGRGALRGRPGGRVRRGGSRHAGERGGGGTGGWRSGA